jgi:hypothetical protein
MNTLTRTFFTCAAAIAMAAAGCTLTLPFDTLTGGPAPSDAGDSVADSAATDAPEPMPEAGGPPVPTSLYSFEEGSGVSVGDTFKKHVGVLEAVNGSPIWTTQGKRGGALDFGRQPGWVNIPTLSSEQLPRVGTLALWLKIRSFPVDDYAPIFAFDDVRGPGPDTDDFRPLATYIGQDLISFEAAVAAGKADAGGSTDPLTEADLPSVPLGSWVLVAVAWDIGAGKGRLFVRPEGHDPAAPAPVLFPPGFKTILPEFNLQTFDGILDEVRFYDRVLTDAELAAID